jgi:hypothetical protein
VGLWAHSRPKRGRHHKPFITRLQVVSSAWAKRGQPLTLGRAMNAIASHRCRQLPRQLRGLIVGLAAAGLMGGCAASAVSESPTTTVLAPRPADSPSLTLSAPALGPSAASFASTPRPTQRPTWSPIPPASTGVLTVLEPPMQDEGVLWAPDGRHFAVLSADSSSVFNVYIFDSAGTWVGKAPGWAAAWASDNTLIVLPSDAASPDGLLTAYIASIGYNDVSTMSALPGRYGDIQGSGRGAALLTTAHGYAVWLDGSLQPKVECGCGPLAISTDGSLVASEDSTGLTVVKTGSGQDVRSWPGLRTGAHLQASFSPDGQHLALSDVDGSLNTLVVLNVSDGRREDLLAGHFVYNGTWASDEQVFAGDDSGGWWFLPVDGASPIRAELSTSSRDAVASSTGAVAAVDDTGSTLLVEKSGKSRTWALPSAALGLQWSPNGSELVVGCESGALVVAQP